MRHPILPLCKALYYLSALAEATPDLPETPTNGVPGQVILPFAGNSTSAAWRIQQPRPRNAGFRWTGPCLRRTRWVSSRTSSRPL